MTNKLAAIALALLLPTAAIAYQPQTHAAEVQVAKSNQRWRIVGGGVQQMKSYDDGYGNIQTARGKWVLVTVNLRNTSKNGITTFEDWHFNLSKLLDSRGSSFEVAEVDPFLRADLLKPFHPGETRSIQFLFDVPNSFTPHTLHLEGEPGLKVRLNR